VKIQSDKPGTQDEGTTQSHEGFCGYRLTVVSTRTDGAYHDHAKASVEIRSEGSDDVLHIVTTVTRSTHQLSKRYRPAAEPVSAALAEAQRWVLDNRLDAVVRQREEREAAQERERARTTDRCSRICVATGSRIIGSVSRTLSPSEVAHALELGSARRLNQYLVAWGLQRRQHDAYVPVDPMHAGQVGLYGTLRWRPSGLKGIWDAALQHGVVTGGDAEFVRRVRTHTDWFDGIQENTDR
jgi:hypothetical protein